MMRRLAFLAAAVLAACATPTATNAQRPAQLAGCYAYVADTLGSGYCTSGVYAVRVTCKRVAFPTYWVTVYGRWSSAGTSKAYCPAGYTAVAAVMVKT